MESAHGQLSAATVATVALTQSNANVIIVHFRSGTGPIYFTVDGSTPTVGGADTFVVHDKLPVRSIRVDTSDAQSVKLISATTDFYSVEVL